MLLIGPVTTIPSACLGEDTNSIPNRPISKFALEQAFNSIPQELHPPAETCLNFSEGNVFLINSVDFIGFNSPFGIKFFRDVEPILWKLVNLIGPSS